MKRHRRHYRLACLLLSTTAMGAPALGQGLAIPPIRELRDQNGVDLIGASFSGSQAGIEIGTPETGGLSYSLNSVNSTTVTGFNASTDIFLSFQDAWTTEDHEPFISVMMGNSQERFKINGASYESKDGTGGTLIQDPSTLGYVYTTRDGTVVTFPPVTSNTDYRGPRATSVLTPNRIRYDYYIKTIVSQFYTATVVNSVVSNTGYQLKFEYAQSVAVPGKVYAINRSSLYCDPNAASCTGANSFPSISLDMQPSTDSEGNGHLIYTITDAAGRVTRWTMGTRFDQPNNDSPVTGIKSPGANDDDVTIGYKYYGQGPLGDVSKIQSVTRRGVTWTYDFPNYGTTQTLVKSTDPSGNTRTVVSDQLTSHVLSDTDAAGATTTYLYNDPFGRLTQINYPGGNHTELQYDSRGNVTMIRKVAKPNSGLVDIVTSAAYPTNCDNPKTCNKPISITDERGGITDYTYDPTHGGVLTITGPAPAPNAARPLTRYEYIPRSATYKNASGGNVSGDPIYVISKVFQCQTVSPCAGTADEVVTQLSYQPSNLLLTGINIFTSAASGTSYAFTYDVMGNVTSVNGPLVGTTSDLDITTYRYDVLRRRVGIIRPPRSSGAKRLAERTLYNNDGLISSIDYGVVNGTADSDWSSIQVYQQQVADFDSAGRLIGRSLIGNGVAQSRVEYSYDPTGRIECVALRMNPLTFGSNPACSQGTEGEFGPDRITKKVYDLVNRRVTIRTGVGVPDLEHDEISYTYNADARIVDVTDAGGNTTFMDHDGFGRRSRMTFPDGKFEAYSYDASGNVVAKTMRNTVTTNYEYDSRGRLSNVYYAASDKNANAHYEYDLLDRTRLARNLNGVFSTTDTYAYDMVGRVTSITSGRGGAANLTKSFAYDLISRQVTLTYSDNFKVNYKYDTLGELTEVSGPGIGTYAKYIYDDYGRRVSRTSPMNGPDALNYTSTAYTYDDASRVKMISISGGSSPVVISVDKYNPAGEIVSRSISNEAYGWNGGYDVSRGYVSNNLNQYSLIGGLQALHDPKGNMSAVGNSTYDYNADNQLTTALGGVLQYDANGRLAWSGATSTRFDYVGTQLVGEYSSNGSLIRRYVFGAGDDEPVMLIEGANTAANRRYLDSDERGSIVRSTSFAGNFVAINSYDDFGINGTGNQGRFQYTGQAWVPEAGLYYYKARMYSSTLGRFMQPDPLFASGVNLYSYVGNNPVNRSDPSGLVFIGLPPIPPGQEIVIDGLNCGLACTDYNPANFKSLTWLAPREDLLNATIVATTSIRPVVPTYIVRAQSPGTKGAMFPSPVPAAVGTGEMPRGKNDAEATETRPAFCRSAEHRLGTAIADFGGVLDRVADAGLVGAVLSGGTGLAPAVAGKMIAGVTQIAGATLQADAGDTKAGARAVAGVVSVILPFFAEVPKGLVNETVGALTDKAAGAAIDAGLGKGSC